MFTTSAGGDYRAISTGGAVTGFGTNFMVIDDLHKADEALTPVGREAAILFYKNTLLSRFNNPSEDRILVIQQRLHEEDIVGWLLEQGGWDHLNLPAIAEKDETIPLAELRHEMVAFPEGRHDDMVDALIVFLEFVYDNEQWIKTQYNQNGRAVRRIRTSRGRRQRYPEGSST